MSESTENNLEGEVNLNGEVDPGAVDAGGEVNPGDEVDLGFDVDTGAEASAEVDAGADVNLSNEVNPNTEANSSSDANHSTGMNPGMGIMSSVSSGRSRRVDRFESGTMPRARSNKTDVWIYQKDGMDFGPFNHKDLIQKFYDGEIDEATSVLNTSLKRRQNLGSIEEFQKEIEEYLPIREHNLAQKRAAQRKKERAAKAGIGGIVLAVLIGIGAMIAIPVIILALQPDPKPLALDSAFPPFEKKFEVPKVEEFSLNVDDSKAKAFFDPKASEAEREAALAAWEAEHRKKYAGRKRPAGGGGGGLGGFGGEDEIETLVFTGDDGEELEPLEQWEIEEQVMSPRVLRKQADCFAKYAGGRTMNVNINFTIQQTGTIRNASTTTSGELSTCLISSISSLKFRPFGGTTKKVSLPVGFD